MMIRGAAAAVVVVLGALLTACATPIAGTPHAATGTAVPPGGGLPLDPEQARLAELFAQVRSWDICAMHDIEAAGRATGFVPDELLPYREPGICRLLMKEPSGVQEWELQIDVFPVIPTDGGGQPLDVGGVQLQQVRDSDESRCAYSYPIGTPGTEPWGIELSVFSIAGNKPPCDVAREYAGAIAPRMADPPLRTAGGTTPALDITASDPCAVAAAMVPAMADGQALGPAAVDVGDLEPYGCTVDVTAGDGPDARRLRGSVEFTITSASDLGGVTIGGFPGTSNQLGINCQAEFAPSDVRLAGNPEISPTVPVVEVVGECDRIDAIATAAAGAVGPPAGHAPRRDAQALGDLDPPPTAASAGAPFDPCTIAEGWRAYPDDVQPPTPRDPVPMTVRPQDPFKVGCKFNAGDMFSSLVWGLPTADGFSADPSQRNAGAVAAQFGGKPGVEETSTNAANGQPTCYSAVQISHGIAAMVTTLPAEPCRVNRAVLEQVARKVP
ncbi:hypothetical protein [Pseudonocardia adelaidensis]|uniref:hypothetical protein n=1 Tax=Pseudonocardia adelaidensis TaxID=648754 RepID=UPI0031E9BC51